MELYQQLPHTADIKIRVFGQTKENLFEHAVIAMFQVLGPHAQGCQRVNDLLVCPVLPKTHAVEVESTDLESLLVDFLSQAWWLSDVYNEAYLAACVEFLTDTRLRATLSGVAISGFDVVEIKAVTYHDLKIKKEGDQWQVDIVFDI